MGRRLQQLFLSPLILWTALFLLGPFGVLFIHSFYTRNPDGSSSLPLSLDAYARLSDPLYASVFFRSLGLAVATSVVCLILAFPVAFYLSQLSTKRRSMALSLILIPMTTSFLIRVFSVMDILRLKPLGLELIYTLPGILIALVYNYLPFAILPLYSSMSRMDIKILEAAQDLGASRRKLLTKVLIPMHKSSIFTALIFTLIPCIGEFIVPALVGGSKHFLIGTFLQNQFMTSRDWPLGSSMIVVILVLTMLALLLHYGFEKRQERKQIPLLADGAKLQ